MSAFMPWCARLSIFVYKICDFLPSKYPPLWINGSVRDSDFAHFENIGVSQKHRPAWWRKKVSTLEISPEIVSRGREPPGNRRRAAESAGTPSKVVVELGAKPRNPWPDTQESNPGGGRGFSGKSDLRSRKHPQIVRICNASRSKGFKNGSSSINTSDWIDWRRCGTETPSTRISHRESHFEHTWFAH